jgi:predicted metal-dependent phosphotriesterase family hydrolase
MNKAMQHLQGQVVTVRGPVEPEKLGAVMMHDHLHVDFYDWEKQQLITAEKPCSAERRRYLLDDAVPLLKECRRYGMGAFVDPTFPPTRAWGLLAFLLCWGFCTR